MIEIIFYVRVIALIMAGLISVKYKNYLGTVICLLYICVTTVNLVWMNPALNAVFSTPLVFLTAWFIIKHSKENK